MFSGDRVRRRMPSEDALNLEESSSFIVEDDDDKYAPKPHGTGLPPLDHGRIRASSEMPQNLYGEHTYPQQHHMYTNTGMGNSMDMGTLGNMSSRESMSHNSSMYNSNPGPYAPAPGTPFDMAYSHLTDAKDAIPDYRAKTHKLALVFMSLMALLTRLFRLGAPPNVVWDEVHFGKFASYYLRRSFFFDVHPPLGKMLYALVGYMAGYDGSYDFAKISTPYKGIEPPVPYFALRLAPALCGTLQVPITYLTVIELGGSNVAAVVASALLLFDNGHITQSRFILLDGWLITFILMAFYFYCCFRTQNRLYPFSVKWWVYLCLSGTFLALAASVKLVGVFVIAVVGVHTALELWRVWKDTRNAIWPTFAAHLGSRVACLIVLPVCIVLCVFQAHFAVLIHSGPGDSHMSRQFQSQLIGSPHAQQVEPMPQDIAFGSIITFTPQQFKPDCWIHSHEHRWPKVYFEGTKKRRVGSAQQQVTCYPHQDHNNQWMVLEPDRYTKYHHNVMNLTMDIDGGEEPHAVTKFVRHGDNIKLYHVSTQTFLHTHDVASYGFPSKQEVSTWNGSETVAPMTDFTIQFTEAGGEAGKRWHPFRTRFRLVHVATQTTLEMSGERLPDFAFGQYEIISSKHTTTKDVFYVDTHKNGTGKRTPFAITTTYIIGLG
ncbi:hypothetical protein SARC_05901 [Sphaeroforma arctica JP610]|uniref:dolichyl-phosphate-mannose--protein mannosyltransferase n=1 Tax=Sphaeroforma arctica JP610 TaxID=667725 RepID=A0A0L0FZ03_9EUKA|nr:hypothetical protein SARC_05901 [Sphaeroforma arctica JP610]KNC81796.1 hypothetical protein SARC_05901 [Sphaeroforma arctica JP610]|eukprot:XP_014155698.1 hypothetical protein SARC_05901 [Sphaeroforma arctica JP610]